MPNLIWFRSDLRVTDNTALGHACRDRASDGVVAEEIGTEPNAARSIRHWQGKEIVVSSDPPSIVQCDGEMIGETPKRISILPAAIQVVVPPPPLPANFAK